MLRGQTGMSAPAYTDDEDLDDEFFDTDAPDVCVDVVRVYAQDTVEEFGAAAYLSVIAGMTAPSRYLLSAHHPEELRALVRSSFIPEGVEVHVGAVVTSLETARTLIPTVGGNGFVHFPRLRGRVPAEVRDLLVEHSVTWVVVGGEACTSVMHPDWVRDLRDFCVLSGISFWFYGWGTWVENVVECGRERIVRAPKTVSPGYCAVHVTGKIALCPSNPHNPFLRGEPGWTVLRRASNDEDTTLLDGRLWDEAPFDLITDDYAR